MTFTTSHHPPAVQSVAIAAAAQPEHPPEQIETVVPREIIVVAPRRDDSQYRTPTELRVSHRPNGRGLIIGSCFSEILRVYMFHAFPGMETDHILYNHAGTLPAAPQHPIEVYDFQLIMLPLRTAMPEQLYFGLNYNDPGAYEAAFEQARERLLQMLHGAMGYREKRQIITFVGNFTQPQQNAMGRLLPRYDLRNPVYFIEMLNRVIADEIGDMANVHLLDIDQISANFGRKYVQDDLASLTNHGSIAADYENSYDQGRIEIPGLLSSNHDFHAGEFLIATCHEVRALYRTLHQEDQVKLVIVDLDDTLWRGVVAEEGIDRPMLTEGWPAGFAEALTFLKRRGILLAIVSKNDEERIRALWPLIYGSRLELSDFAAIRINWEPKADNVAKIMQDMNLLPRSVVFIDDNPVERDNVKSAFPDIRLLGASPYELRRVLLWSPETQVAYITDESARRTQMIQAQAERETSRTRLTRAEFLETLNITIRLFAINDVKDARFARAFELVNKSNQFNTTGRRWTLDDCHTGFASGVNFWAFEVDDRFTHYGVVGVAIADRTNIRQFVMSCRVMGLEVEVAVIAAILENMEGDVIAAYSITDANFPCRDLYERCGFTEAPDGWHKSVEVLVQRPAHVRAVERHIAEPVA